MHYSHELNIIFFVIDNEVIVQGFLEPVEIFHGVTLQQKC